MIHIKITIHFTVQWLHRGVKLVGSSRVMILANNSLHITNLTAADSGDYHCEVENWEGADRDGGMPLSYCIL